MRSTSQSWLDEVFSATSSNSGPSWGLAHGVRNPPDGRARTALYSVEAISRPSTDRHEKARTSPVADRHLTASMEICPRAGAGRASHLGGGATASWLARGGPPLAARPSGSHRELPKRRGGILYVRSVMPRRLDLSAAVTELGKEFVRRGMTEHRAQLRGFWRQWKGGDQPGRKKGDWSWELVVEWLCLLRIPPFEKIFPLHPRASSICPGCEVISERESPTAITVSTWAGGCLTECRRCGVCWLTDSAWEAARAGLTMHPRR
jgi:hypothetical protein